MVIKVHLLHPPSASAGAESTVVLPPEVRGKGDGGRRCAHSTHSGVCAPSLFRYDHWHRVYLNRSNMLCYALNPFSPDMGEDYDPALIFSVVLLVTVLNQLRTFFLGTMTLLFRRRSFSLISIWKGLCSSPTKGDKRRRRNTFCPQRGKECSAWHSGTSWHGGV